MFNLGFLEMLAIVVIALVVIGPKQLPQVARVIGRLMGEFRRASSDFHREIYNAQEGLNKHVSHMEDNLHIDDILSPDKKEEELEKKIEKSQDT